MKRYSLLAVVIVAGLCLAAWIGTSLAQEGRPAATPVKAAVCDVVAVFKNYQRAKDLTDKLKERLDGIKAESDKRGKAIDKLKMTLEQLMVGTKEYEDRLSEMTKLSIEREAWLTYQDTLAKQENFRLTKEMYQEILQAVGKIAKQRGYDLVLFKEADDQPSRTLDELLQQMARRKVLYSDGGLDITEDVLVQLNSDYKAKGTTSTTAP